MTEDGRSFGWPAPCSPRPSLHRAPGKQDAQLDAIANSLRLRGTSNFALSCFFNLFSGSCMSVAPRRTTNRVFLPIPPIFKENRYENLPWK